MARPKLLLRLAFVSALVGSGRTLAFRPPGQAGGGIIFPRGTTRAGGSAAVPPMAVVVGRGGGSAASSSSLGMAPRFDKSSQKWFTTNPEVSARLKEMMDLACDVGHTFMPTTLIIVIAKLTPNPIGSSLLPSPFPPRLCCMYSTKMPHKIRRRVLPRVTASSGASTAPVRCHSFSASSTPNRTSRRCSSTWRRRDATAS
jgi:hypothetical protein